MTTMRRGIKTASTAPLAPGVVQNKGFHVTPSRVDFGVMREGYLYAAALTLANTGVETRRFKVVQPAASSGLKVVFTPGGVAAGMSTTLQLQLRGSSRSRGGSAVGDAAV